MRNDQKYLEQFKLLFNSGSGVILTRTREPYRAMETLEEYSIELGLPYFQWDHVRGWLETLPSQDPNAEPKVHKMPDPFGALKFIKDVDNGGQQAKEQGIFVMNAVHHWLGKHPGITEVVRQYVRQFAEEPTVRLVFIMPETFILPDELTHDIPVLDFDMPSATEVEEILDYIIESSTDEGRDVPTMFEEEEKETIVASACGLTTMQAELAFAKAVVSNKPEEGAWHEIEFDDFNRSVLDAKTEVVKQSEVLELMPPVSMKDVGGLDQLKRWAKVSKKCFSAAALDFGVHRPKGICAVGPPGTGKTLIGKAIASLFGQPLVKFDVSKCFGKYVGESEGKVRAALKQLEAMGQVTVLFDEVDKSLGGSHQGGGDSGVSQRVLGSILTFLQESDAPIFPIFTANRTGSLPPELLRKGRMDEIFAVMPPNRAEREAIFRIHLAKSKQDADAIEDLDLAVVASKGYVSAELEAAVKEAVKEAFVNDVEVTGELIRDQLAHMKPLSEAFAEDFAAMSEWAANNARLASTPVEEAEEDAPPRRRAVKKQPRRRAVKSGS